MELDVNDIENLKACSKCGVVFDYTIGSVESMETNYEQSPGFEGKCPVCKQEFTVIE